MKEPGLWKSQEPGTWDLGLNVATALIHLVFTSVPIFTSFFPEMHMFSPWNWEYGPTGGLESNH
jgi:hypothetical protein